MWRIPGAGRTAGTTGTPTWPVEGAVWNEPPGDRHDDANDRPAAGSRGAGGRRAQARWHGGDQTQACAGFTLIEVVMALAVLAISLVAIGAVATTSARGTRSIEQHLALVETTRVIAATLPQDRQKSLDGLSGEVLGHRWRISLAPFIGSGIYRMPDSEWIPQTVVVRVRSPSGAVYGFETVRLKRREVR